MNEHLQAMGRERWPLLEAVNMIEMLSYLGTSELSETQVTDEIEWVITGVWDNTFNGVARVQLSEAHVDRVIAEVVSRFRERDVPHLWFHNVDSSPPNLEQRLMAHGWVRLLEGLEWRLIFLPSLLRSRTRQVSPLNESSMKMA